MSNRRFALAAIALLVSAAPAMAQHFNAPPGACGYYINSLGHAVLRPCGDWQTLWDLGTDRPKARHIARESFAARAG